MLSQFCSVPRAIEGAGLQDWLFVLCYTLLKREATNNCKATRAALVWCHIASKGEKSKWQS